MLKFKKKQSLAECINDVITDGAKTFDSDDEDEVTKAKVVDQHSESDSDDVPTGTSFRKQNVHLLDEVDARYQGKKVSRKDIYENESYDSDGDLESDKDSGDAMDDLCDTDFDDGNSDSQQEADDNSDAEVDDDDDDDNDKEKEEDDNDNEEDNDNDNDNESEISDDEESDFDEDNPLGRNRDGENNFPSMTPININQEIEKGNCVRNQLKAWENLLEMRIKLQKCLSTSNKMPQYDVFKEYQTDKQFIEAAKDTKKKLSNALEGLLELQEKLWKNNPETKNLLSNKQNNDKSKTNEDDSMDEEIPSDTDEEMEHDDKDKSDNDDDNDDDDTKEPANKKRKTLDEFEKILEKRHAVYTPYRNSVIQKWNDKTRVAAGNASKGTSQAVVKQIEFLLSNKQKLISRTQLKRSEYSIIGKKDQVDDDDGRRIQEYDTEIYDDDDFYHQLLRELIEHKSADITDPIQLGKQWVQLQNMRTKMKRKIDTRATKGRRVRYNVHTKLVNFMAPNALDDTWSDVAKTELYNSLFGKIKVVQRNQKKNEPDVENI